MFKKLALFFTIALTGFTYATAYSQGYSSSGGVKYNILQDEGKKVWLNSDFYMIYKFSKKPVIGTVVLKIEVFTRDGKKDTSLKISGDAGMPSMPGAHDSGDVDFKLNRKGDYLLPVNIVMPGDWEVRVKFKKDNKSIYFGSVRFDV